MGRVLRMRSKIENQQPKTPMPQGKYILFPLSLETPLSFCEGIIASGNDPFNPVKGKQVLKGDTSDILSPSSTVQYIICLLFTYTVWTTLQPREEQKDLVTMSYKRIVFLFVSWLIALAEFLNYNDRGKKLSPWLFN